MPQTFDGIHQGLFRPPVSTSTSPGYLSPARPSGEPQTSKRKRIRDDANRHSQDLLHGSGSGQGHGHTHEQGGSIGSNTVLITPAGRHAHNGRPYTLAGQIGHSPNAEYADGDYLGESVYSDVDYRKGLGSRRSQDVVDPGDSDGRTGLFDLPAISHEPTGWGTLAFSTIGGVVGKVWEFCKAGAFKGFYAGGGRGFDLQTDNKSPSDGSLPWQAWAGDDAHHEQHQRIPGRFPQERDSYFARDISEDGFIPSGASTPSTPAAKRRQTAATDDLGRNWVVVKEQSAANSSSTPRRTSSHAVPPLRNRNQGPSLATGRRISTPNSRRVSGQLPSRSSFRASPRSNDFQTTTAAALEPPRPASSASFASPRSPSPTKLSGSATANSASIESPTLRGSGRRRTVNPTSSHQTSTHVRTHSNASTASGRGAGEDVSESPRLTSEAKHLAARRQREERDTDVRMSAFNKQLQDMIRQGKEALGTTIEIDGEDGSWEDY